MIGTQVTGTTGLVAGVKDTNNPPTTADNALVVSISPITAAPSIYNAACLGNTTPVAIKASAGTLLTVSITNNAAAARSVKFYNSGNPTVGTTVPLFSVTMAASSSQCIQVGGNYGLKFSAAIAWAVTSGTTFADTGAPTANDIVLTANYV